MSDPTLVTDHVGEALAKLLIQFRGQPHLQQILSSYVVQIQELEAVFISLIDERYVLTAVGAQLDGVGRLVGETRQGRDDDDYRIAIIGKIELNRSNGLVEDIIALFLLLLPSHTVTFSRGVKASFILAINEALPPSDPSPAALDAQLQRFKGGGIRAHLLHSGFDDSLGFTFATGSTPEVDALKGFSDVAGSTGGHFASVVS